jgi:putative (di)nucleoside polyphosphate hydrolase
VGRYRPNVAALLVNQDGRLLVCERLAIPGAWQFPQGGVDAGESPEEAILREVEEEVGLQPSHYRIEESKGGYRYDYPAKVREEKPPHKAGYVGQEQTYFLCRVDHTAPEVDLSREPREFSRFMWIDPTEFDLNWLPDFKKETYRAVLADFFEMP